MSYKLYTTTHFGTIKIHATPADDEKAIVGELLGAPAVGLVHVHVEEMYRRRGVATKLIHEYVESAKKLGIKTIVFTCDSSNTAAMNLYRKLGFTIEKNNHDSCIGDRVCTKSVG
jgi:ribosomal protein S18 acetylase RimI-like enzyme